MIVGEIIIIFGLSLYKILIIVIAFISCLFFVSRVRRKKSTIPTLVLWILFCILVIFIGFFPRSTDPLANIFGMQRGLDFIIILGFAFCIYLIFKLYVKVDNMNQEISELVRQLAIEKEKSDSFDKDANCLDD